VKSSSSLFSSTLDCIYRHRKAKFHWDCVMVWFDLENWWIQFYTSSKLILHIHPQAPTAASFWRPETIEQYLKTLLYPIVWS
jgi:hypothetical protein